jgi:hypothetical protein
MLYMSAHGRPRFAATITDQATIRVSVLLGVGGQLKSRADGQRG